MFTFVSYLNGKKMTFQEYKQLQLQLSILTDELGSKLRGLSKHEGLVLDEIKKTDKYKSLKNDYNIAFKKFQDINSFGVKTFKKELQKERSLKRQLLTK